MKEYFKNTDEEKKFPWEKDNFMELKNTTMALFKKLARNNIFYSSLFGITTFLFFGFFYTYHLFFEEQFQFFLFTSTYFMNLIILPGGISAYFAGFLTQFYVLPYAGAFTISFFLIAVQLLTTRIIHSVNRNPSLFPLSFFPALGYWFVLCDNLFPLSGLIGFVFILSFITVYQLFRNRSIRSVFGIVSIFLLYFISGIGNIVFLISVIVLEISWFFRAKSKLFSNLKIILPSLLIMTVVAVFIPVTIKNVYLQVPIFQAYTSDIFYQVKGKIPFPIWIILAFVPILIIGTALSGTKFRKPAAAIILQLTFILAFTFWGLKTWMNPNAEEIMRYDYYARNQKWDQLINHAKKEPPRNNLSLSMLNLALAKTGKMPVDLFKYKQKPGGLFLEFNHENVSPMMGNEIFYQMGMTNASQYFAFESTESTPDLQKSVRAFKRLAETNLINGNYAVASKYVSLLKKTLFYRNWALNTQKYVDNPELISTNAEWSEKRQMAVQHDYFIMVPEMEKIMISMLNEHPANKIVFEYLMSYYLINKNLDGFMANLYRIQYLNYPQMPVLYQEAALFAISLKTEEPEKVNVLPISIETKRRMRAYADVYTSSPNAKDILKEKFSGTFWYYFHFN